MNVETRVYTNSRLNIIWAACCAAGGVLLFLHTIVALYSIPRTTLAADFPYRLLWIIGSFIAALFVVRTFKDRFAKWMPDYLALSVTGSFFWTVSIEVFLWGGRFISDLSRPKDNLFFAESYFPNYPSIGEFVLFTAGLFVLMFLFTASAGYLVCRFRTSRFD